MFQDYKIFNSHKIQFVIKDIDLSIVNSIRRIILSEVPIIGCYFDAYDFENNDIKIIKNTTVLHNEITSHRISLIPMYFDENELHEFNEEKYKFTINKKNNTTNVLNITTNDIEIFNKDDVKYDSNFHSRIFPKNDITNNHILITKLKPNLYNTNDGEELNVEFKCRIGIGKLHARWCPTSLCCFENVVDEEQAEIEFNNKFKDTSELRAEFNSLEKYRYFKKNKYDEPCEFLFKIESECGLSPEYIIFKALVILMRKFQYFITTLENSITQINNIDNFYQITILDEDHTLLNPLQCLIYNNTIRKNNKILDYIGYYQLHPLDNKMIVKLKFSKSNFVDIQYVRNFITQNVNVIIEYLDTIIKEWIKFTKLDKTNIIELKNYL